MPIRTYPGRVLFVAVTFCLLLLALCGTVALYLYREQDRTAAVLGEDIGSRGAAINLETTLNNLAVLHDRNSRDVEPLHEQAATDLTEIDRFADKDEERRLAAAAAADFGTYLLSWRAAAPPADLARFLRERVVPAVVTLRLYNGRALQRSEEQHRRSLRRMAWGLAAVGGLGSVAGLVLGYGLARSLRRTIHHFLRPGAGRVRPAGAGSPGGRVAPDRGAPAGRGRRPPPAGRAGRREAPAAGAGGAAGPSSSPPSASSPPASPTRSATRSRRSRCWSRRRREDGRRRAAGRGPAA